MAFSLVEVVVAVGIATFCLVALIGLLSVGLNLGRDSRDELQAAHVLQGLLAVRRASPSGALGPEFPLPALTETIAGTSGETLVSPDGKVVVSVNDARFRLIYHIGLEAELFRLRTQISWPAGSKPENAAGRIEMISAIPKDK